jgi:hypothetical protein
MPVTKMYRKPKPITKLIDPTKSINKLYNLYSIYNSLDGEKLKENFRTTLEINNIEITSVVKALRLNRNTVYAYLNMNNVAKPTLELLVRICVEFQIEIEDFLTN